MSLKRKIENLFYSDYAQYSLFDKDSWYNASTKGFWGTIAKAYSALILLPIGILATIPAFVLGARDAQTLGELFKRPVEYLSNAVTTMYQNCVYFMKKHKFALKVATLGLALALSVGLLVAFPPAGIAGVIGFGGQLAATLGLSSLNVGLYAAVMSGLTFAATAVLGGLTYLGLKLANCCKQSYYNHKHKHIIPISNDIVFPSKPLEPINHTVTQVHKSLFEQEQRQVQNQNPNSSQNYGILDMNENGYADPFAAASAPHYALASASPTAAQLNNRGSINSALTFAHVAINSADLQNSGNKPKNEEKRNSLSA